MLIRYISLWGIIPVIFPNFTSACNTILYILISGLYNIIFTSLPPLAIGVFDQSCSAIARMNFPALYQETQKGVFFNNKVFWKWILNAILHSMVLFWLPMGAFTYGTVWKNGFNGDYLALGNTVYTCTLLTVCLKLGLETNAWNWIIHLSIWGSIVLWYCYLTVTSYFWPTLPLYSEMTGMIGQLVQTPFFWLSMLLVPFTTLIPDITLQSIILTAHPSATDKVRIREHGKVPVIDRIYKLKHTQRNHVKDKTSNEQMELEGTAV